MQNLKQKFNEIKKHKFYNELMQNAKNLKSGDTVYEKKLTQKRSINHQNDGDGYYTNVTGASYETNYSHSLQITKQYYKQIISRKYSYDLYNMLLDDLEYYEQNYTSATKIKKYLYSDIKLLFKFGLVEKIGSYYIISNLNNIDTITIKECDIIFNDFIYTLLFNYKSSCETICFNYYYVIYLFYTTLLHNIHVFVPHYDKFYRQFSRHEHKF